MPSASRAGWSFPTRPWLWCSFPPSSPWPWGFSAPSPPTSSPGGSSGWGGEDAAALAAHYGSVSAVTFLAALTFVQAVGDAAPGFMPTLVALLEVPGIVVALLLAKRREGRLGEALHEVLTGKSVVLLLGGFSWASFPARRG